MWLAGHLTNRYGVSGFWLVYQMTLGSRVCLVACHVMQFLSRRLAMCVSSHCALAIRLVLCGWLYGVPTVYTAFVCRFACVCFGIGSPVNTISLRARAFVCACLSMCVCVCVCVFSLVSLPARLRRAAARCMLGGQTACAMLGATGRSACAPFFALPVAAPHVFVTSLTIEMTSEMG